MAKAALMVTTTAKEAMDCSAGDRSTSLPELLDRCLFSGIIAVDSRLQITAFSDEARLLLSLSDAGPAPLSFDSLPAPLIKLFTETFQNSEAPKNLQIKLANHCGEPRLIKVSSTLMKSAGGSITGVVVTLNDITPARQLEQNLRQMDRLASIGTLSASMAHEVKNALVAVKTFVDLLITNNQDAPLTDIVGREMKRIDSIVSQMLRFGGPARPTLGTVHLHQVLDQSLNLVQHHLEGRKIKLLRSLNALPDTVRGDAYQLEQAFINLFFNALDAMGADGVLHVSTEFVPAESSATNQSPVVQVIVQDNGIGIPADNLSRLFEPFFTTKPNGTGLGLPITRRIIEEHRGSIAVTSEPHQGTKFVLSLPSTAAHQP